jgi:outer membrane protein OmpA-like peptidoglycan-associated protein
MELSVLRALTVHSYLAENYVKKDNLIVAGYGSQQKISDNDQEEIDMNRRISLRLQLVK